ncbi:MAG TPA: signal peptidase II [Acidimicrobiales bacterium]|nr:signal peptidase II [Acidimicrobiales bacterium]
MQERGTAPPLSTGAHRRGARRLWLTLGVAALVVAADQASKSWAVHRLSSGSIHVVWRLDLVLGYNSGSSFSLAQGWGSVLAALAVVFVVVLLASARRAQSALMSVAIGLIVGGALGNLADRVFRTHHSVVDFVALHFWPTFNVADSCIVVGGLLAGLALWRTPAAPAEEEASPAPAATAAEGSEGEDRDR